MYLLFFIICYHLFFIILSFYHLSSNNIILSFIFVNEICLDLQQDISKRLSLPADLRIPEAFLAKQSNSASPILDDGPLSRTTRRQSLSEIGFGRMETYTKLDKLGEVLAFSFDLLGGRSNEAIFFCCTFVVVFIFEIK